MRYGLVVVVLSLFAFQSPAFSQSDYELAITGGLAAVDHEAKATIYLTSADDADSVRIAVCHDTDGLVLNEIIEENYLADLDPVSQTIEEHSGGFTAVVIADLEADGTLPATDGAEAVYTVVYETLDEGTYSLEFCDTLGDPEVTSAVVVEGEDVETVLTEAEIEVSGQAFRRGDADGNGRVEGITDAYYLLRSGFHFIPPCLEAADADNNGTYFPILDTLYLLEWAFDGGDAPADPGPFVCGPDPEGGDVGCGTPPECADEFEIPSDIDQDFELSLVAGPAIIDSPLDVEVVIDVDPDAAEEISGFQFGVCHDDLLSLAGEDSISEGGRVSAADTTFQSILVEDDSWSVGFVMNGISGATLDLDEDMTLYTVEYEAVELGESELTFCATGSVDDNVFPVFAFVLIDLETSVVPETVDATITIHEPSFLRGDADGNGVVFPILDALYVLEWGFTDGPHPPCSDAADADDDGELFPILEAILILGWGFTNGPSPPDPGPTECGEDPTDDKLTCAEVSEGCL